MSQSPDRVATFGASESLLFSPSNTRVMELNESIQNILQQFSPSEETISLRKAVFDYFSTILTRINRSCYPFLIDQHSLNLSLPDGDVKVGVYVSGEKVNDMFRKVLNTLRLRSEMSRPVKMLKAIAAATNTVTNESSLQSMQDILKVCTIGTCDYKEKILTCTIAGVSVVLTTNTSVPLSRIGFVNSFSTKTKHDVVIQQCMQLLRLWGFTETHFISTDYENHGLRVSALQTMLLMIINCYFDTKEAVLYHKQTGYYLSTPSSSEEQKDTFTIPLSPIVVLYKFFQVYSRFDFTKYCVTISGPVSIAAYRAIMGKHKYCSSLQESDLGLGKVNLPYLSLDAPSSTSIVCHADLQTIINTYNENTIDSEISEHKISYVVPKHHYFRFRDMNIADIINPVNNIGETVDMELSHKMIFCFRKAAAVIFSALQGDTEADLAAMLFPSLSSQFPQMIRNSCVLAETRVANVGIDIAIVQEKLQRLRLYVREQAEKNKPKQ